MKFPTESSIEIEAFKKSRVPLPTASGRDLIVATRKTTVKANGTSRAHRALSSSAVQAAQQAAARPDMHERTQAAYIAVAVALEARLRGAAPRGCEARHRALARLLACCMA